MRDPKNTENGHKTRDESELDKALEILSKTERRETLRFLRELEGDKEATVGDIAKYLRDLDCEIDGAVELSLHHSHLQKMDDEGLIKYESGDSIPDGLVEYNGDEYVEHVLNCIYSPSETLEPFEEGSY